MARCVANPDYKVIVFCPNKRIAEETCGRLIDFITKTLEDGNYEKVGTIAEQLHECKIKLWNGSTVSCVYSIENLMELEFNEALYHSLLTLDRYGDTVKLLQMILDKRGGDEVV